MTTLFIVNKEGDNYAQLCSKLVWICACLGFSVYAGICEEEKERDDKIVLGRGIGSIHGKRCVREEYGIHQWKKRGGTW